MLKIEIIPWAHDNQPKDEWEFRVTVQKDRNEEYKFSAPLTVPIHKSLLDQLFETAKRTIETEMERTFK